MKFEEAGIGPELSRALARKNIGETSAIQAAVIPALCKALDAGIASESGEAGSDAGVEAAGSTSGADVAAEKSRAFAKGMAGGILFTSPTGTGKTFAYLLPLFQRLVFDADGANHAGASAGPAILVLAPTYELCSQIKGEADFLLSEAGRPSFKTALLIGSAPLDRQIDTIKKNKPFLAAGNPARVLQLVKMKKLSLKNLRALIFDEGDRLVGDEFFPETAETAGYALHAGRAASRSVGGVSGHGVRQGTVPFFIACSATFSPKNREKLFSLGLFISPEGEGGRRTSGVERMPDEKNWETIAQTENDILRKNIEHWAFFAEERDKISLLRSFLSALRPKKALVFTSRASSVGTIVSKLQHHHYPAAGLWGNMDKKSRKAAIDGFRGGGVSVLVSSDLAARGLDIEGISHIIALDVAQDSEVYIHRAGRTARAGKRGIMASFGGEDEMMNLSRIEKKLGIAVYPKELFQGRLRAPE